ncbi:esterase/lipase family protein [Paraliomyxa miuraensis]|uniref:esterase/lipase family protein n=1 Tax=Paraliomyxa miuraensis TaxID=376150 RepID=UPI002251B2C9|nr:triacylglycerol lipase [Paraliomyxa miuraensis]MCX4245190.1 triacylglycerol lipase [Paraliomyxa miuraensis]
MPAREPHLSRSAPRPTRRVTPIAARALGPALALPLLGCADPGSVLGSGGGETSATGSTTTPGSSSTLEADSTAASIECSDGQTEVVQSFLPTPGQTGLVQLAPCERWHRWYFAAPAGSTVELALTGHDDIAVEALVGYPDVPQLAAVIDGDTLQGPLESGARATETLLFQAPRSGEFAVQIAASEELADAQYELEITCESGCELETTRFPMVLVHGWTGFANIGPVDYFFEVPGHLTERGYPVSVTETDKYNTSLVRAEQLAEQVDVLLSSWRARKVDLIGHSQGGIDARALISTLGHGDRVAALVTIGSPHQGSYAVDVALGLAPGPSQEVLFLLFDFLGAVTDDEKADVEASLHSLSEAHMQSEFNPNNPDDPRVEYISYTGISCAPAEFLDPQNDCQDVVDPIWTLTYGILKAARGANDGLVTVQSAQWGDFRGLMSADHLDEVGQFLGVTDPAFDHLQFFLDRARELAESNH